VCSSDLIFRVDVVIVSGHQHTVFGLGNATCAPATIPPVTTTMPTTTTTMAAAAAVTPPAPTGGITPVATPAAAGAAVTAAAKAGPKVLGTNVSRTAAVSVEPAVAGTALARTGPHTRLLLLMAGFALALGGIALMVGEPRRLAPVRAS